MLKRTENGNYEYEISIADFLETFKKFWVLIVAAAFVVAAVVFAYFHITYVPMYTASVQVVVYNSDVEDMTGISDNYEFDKAEKLTTSFMDQIMKRPDYLHKVVEKYELHKLGYTAESIRSKISVSLVGSSGNYFQISVKDPIPSAAAMIVDAVVSVFKTDIVYAGIVRTFGEGADPATLPSDTSKAPMMGAVSFALTFVLMLFVITLWRVRDTRIRSAEDIAEVFDYPIIGTIPCIDKFPDRKKTNKANKGRAK